MKKRLKIVVPVLVLAVLVFVVWRLVGDNKKLPDGAVAANGTIEVTEVDVAPKVAGRIVSLPVEEGDDVQAGQVIAVLDGEEIKAQVEQAEGAYSSVEAKLADLQKGSREEQIRQAKADLERAQASKEGARLALETAKENYSKSTELKARLTSAQAAYDAAVNAHKQAAALAENARADAKRGEQLYSDGVISSQQWDAAVTKRDSAEAAEAQAEAQMKGAKDNLNAAKELYSDKLPLKQQVDSAQTAYNAAVKQVQAGEAALDLLIAGPTPDTLKAAQGQVDSAQGALKAAKSLSDDLTVKSPLTGVVLIKPVEAGELVAAGSVIVRIANMDSVWVRVYVPLTDLNIRVGDRAVVTVDAYPNREFEGVVSEISQKPEFTPKNVQTKEERVKQVFGVKITLDNRERDLKPGMPADAIIYTGK